MLVRDCSMVIQRSLIPFHDYYTLQFRFTRVSFTRIIKTLRARGTDDGVCHGRANEDPVLLLSSDNLCTSK